MSELTLQSVWSPPLKNLSASFGPGMHVLLGAEADGTADVIELCAGVRLPRRGRVALDGEVPGGSPSARRQIASLLPNESWTLAGSISSWLEELSQLRGSRALEAARRFCPELEPGRSLASLSGVERRELALAAALGEPTPKLVALHEPLAAARGGAVARVLERLQALALEVPVLVATRSVADARRCGGRLLVLERGVLVRGPSDAWPSAMTPGLRVELWVECDAPRRLLAQLATSPEVEQASFDGRAGGRIELRGNDLERLALAVTRAALAAGVELRQLRAATPDLETVHGASAGLAHAAYRAAQDGRRPAPPEPARRP